VNGDWKALLRLHRGNEIIGVPVFLPEDPAIPAKGVPASKQFARGFTADHKILQRESKGASGILPVLAYLGVLAIALSLCALMAWGLGRLAKDGAEGLPGDPADTKVDAVIERGRPTATSRGAATPA
jgi:hypothetical protein